MTDIEKKIGKKTAREKAELLVKMTKEAKGLERKTGATACVVICMFEEGNELFIQDAGRFPMFPEEFYTVMINAHRQGLLGSKNKILKPH